MRYVYILKCVDTELYIGTTNNLKQRLERHLGGRVKSTKKRLPAKLIYYEAFTNEKDAWNREKYLKTGWGRRHLVNMLEDTLKV